MPEAAYAQDADRLLISSDDAGQAVTNVVTPRKRWGGLGKGLKELLDGVELHSIDPGGQVTMQLQWSLDGETWNTGSTFGAARTAVGQYSAAVTQASEMQYWVRTVATIQHAPTPTARKTAVISVWSHYKYT